MDTTTLPPWAQTVLAITTVVIVALTMLANFLDWAVPRLRALGPKGEPARALTAIEKFALALTTVLGFVHRLMPRLTVVEPKCVIVTAPTTPSESAPATQASCDAPQAAKAAAVPSVATEATPSDTNPPHGPFAS